MTMPFVDAGELMVRRNGSVNPSKFPDEEFELHSIPAFDAGKPAILRGDQIGSTKQVVAPNDVMISKIVPHIRRASIVPDFMGRRQIASGEWIVFRSAEFFPDYLRHALTSNDFHAKFMATVSGVGGSLLRASPAEVAKIKIPLPPLADQRRIAGLLSHAEGIVRLRREAQAKTAELIPALFLDMFGDPAINPKGWPIFELVELLAEPPTLGTMSKPSKEPADWLDLRVANIQDGKLTLVDKKWLDLPEQQVARFALRNDDMLLARAIGSLDHLGKAVIVSPTSNWTFDSHLMRVRLNQDRLLPIVFKAFLESTSGRNEFLKYTRRSAVQFNINGKELRKIRVPLPPIRLQHEFVAKAESVEAIAAHQANAMATAQATFDALLSRAFPG